MERVTLNAEVRTEKGKGVARELRRNEKVPGVVYREGKATAIQLAKKELIKFINSTLGEQMLVNLKFSDGKTKLALMKDYQCSPVKGELLHTDFYEVSLKEKVKVAVAINLTGEAIGIKRDGGILQHGLREVEVECLPEKIPTNLEIDISHLEIGHAIHVKDLSLADDVKLLTAQDEVIAIISAPAKVVAEEVEAEAEVEVEAEVEEPEVVKKGKSEEKKEE